MIFFFKKTGLRLGNKLRNFIIWGQLEAASSSAMKGVS